MKQTLYLLRKNLLSKILFGLFQKIAHHMMSFQIFIKMNL